MNSPKIAVCISTHNRREIFKRTHLHHEAVLPPNARIFVVDDASDSAVPWADYRFEQNAGIARVKNKCLELAAEWGAEHIFLFDDDTYPVTPDWWQPYVNGKEPHYMYIFNQANTGKGHHLKPVAEVYRDSEVVAYSHIRGCMLYVERLVLDIVGGFDPEFGKAMYEHGDFTNRIHRAGLTTHRVMDVPNSDKLIYSLDEHRKVDSTITPQERSELLRRNKLIRDRNKDLPLYREFKEAI